MPSSAVADQQHRTVQSGAPFSVSLSTPTANTGTFTRPNRVCNGNLPSPQQTINAFFDNSPFSPPLSIRSEMPDATF